MLQACKQAIHRMLHPTERVERLLEQIQTQNRQIIDHLRIANYYANKRDKEKR